LKKSDTYNSTSKQYDYPQTPSRVQLSLWPGGLETNDIGTINWAGGKIDWVNTPDMKDPGYYYVQVKDVTVKCYDPPSSAKIKGSKSYYYDDVAGYESNVVIGDRSTVLGSFLATGTNMTATSASDEDVETVPGLTGAGTGAGNRANAGNNNDASGSGGSSGTTTDTEDQGVNTGSGSNEFEQGDTGNASSDAMALKVFQGSMITAILAVGMLVL
jgi:hypothetical protein